MINVFSIIHSAPPSAFTLDILTALSSITLVLVLYFDRIPWWGNIIITASVGLLVGFIVMFVVKPRLRKSIEGSFTVQHLHAHQMLFSSGTEKEAWRWNCRRWTATNQNRRSLRDLYRYIKCFSDRFLLFCFSVDRIWVSHERRELRRDRSSL